MANITNRFVLKFNSNLGKVLRISIPRACRNKTNDAIQVYMDSIIENGIVSITDKGTPTSIKAAQIVETERIRRI